jgi:hypothetical protein
VDWDAPEVRALLGTMSNSKVARRLNVSRERVRQVCAKLGIPRFTLPPLPDQVVAELGRDRDAAIAVRAGLSIGRVRAARALRGIPAFRSPCGTRTRYNHGCRCGACRRANADNRNAWVRANPKKAAANRERARTKALATAPHDPGTVSKYVLGCRCPGCRAAASAYVASRKTQPSTDAT